jgi:hypothetical protein
MFPGISRDGEQGQREKQEAASIASVVPDAFRRGDFSAITTPLRDPLGGTFAGNQIPAGRISDISQRYLEIHPRPNQAGLSSNVAGVDQQINNTNQIFTRGDHNIGNRDKLFARGALFNYDFPTVSINCFSAVNSRITARNAVLSQTHIFSPALMNEAKFGCNRNRIIRSNPRTNTSFDPESVGLTNIRAELGVNSAAPGSARDGIRAHGAHGDRSRVRVRHLQVQPWLGYTTLRHYERFTLNRLVRA